MEWLTPILDAVGGWLSRMATPDRLTRILPVTVIAAIGLFFVKEALEARRRSRADERKKKAFRKVLAREVELNNWTLSRMKQILETVQQDFAEGAAVEYELAHVTSERTSFVRRSVDGVVGGSLPHVHSKAMEKVLLDVAALDDTLFAALEEAYDAAAEMRHLRDSLVNFVETEDEHTQHFFAAFPQYALTELQDVEIALGKLYRECTGKKLTVARLR